MSRPKDELPEIRFADRDDWAGWLEEHHSSAPGVWLRIAKKEAGRSSVSYQEALEAALCYGWIDGQKRALDAGSWLQKFTRRGPRSVWSKINRDRAEALIEIGQMRPAGAVEVERAKADGRWAAAYDSPSTAAVPDDLQAELDERPEAKAFFETLNSANRYAIIWRLQTAKRAETRTKRLRQFVEMLERREKLHP
jgi:uncharacterized protein YdeI (YjbR/CyaY-like superfamily)